MSKMFNPPHPGRMLSETLQYRGLSAEAFADMIGIDPHSLADILCEKRPFTPKIAERISAVISDPSPEIWLAIQRDYDEWQRTHCLSRAISFSSP